MGSGGGGSSSGEVSYPDYMQNRHDAWLADVTTCMAEARAGASPYAGWSSVDVEAVFGSMAFTPNGALSSMNTFSLDGEFGAAYGTLSGHDVAVPTLDEAAIAAAVQSEADLLTSEANRALIPTFEGGMNDINAVQSSAFVVGKALIMGDVARKVADFDAKLRVQSASLNLDAAKLGIAQVQGKHDFSFKLATGKMERFRLMATLAAEVGRIYTAARLEADKTSVEMAAKDRLFDLSTFQYGSNVLASISGGSVHPNVEGSTVQSVLGGALSGASAGAMVAGPWGAAAGAVLGGIGGYMSSR